MWKCPQYTELELELELPYLADGGDHCTDHPSSQSYIDKQLLGHSRNWFE